MEMLLSSQCLCLAADRIQQLVGFSCLHINTHTFNTHTHTLFGGFVRKFVTVGNRTSWMISSNPACPGGDGSHSHSHTRYMRTNMLTSQQLRGSTRKKRDFYPRFSSLSARLQTDLFHMLQSMLEHNSHVTCQVNTHSWGPVSAAGNELLLTSVLDGFPPKGFQRPHRDLTPVENPEN